MPGGILNIVAQGENNALLFGNASKSHFRATYHKSTNFGMQKFYIDYQGSRSLRLTESSEFKFVVPRYAELLMDTYVVITIPDIYSPIYPPCDQTGNKWAAYEFNWVQNLGTQLIQVMLSKNACTHLKTM